MSEFSTWYKQVPQFTRYWLTATLGFSVLAKLGIIPAGLLYLDSTLVFQKFQVICLSIIRWFQVKILLYLFQIWRLLTSLFFYPTGFHFLMNCFFLYNYSSRLEKDHYLGSPGDYLYLLIFNWLCCALVGIFASLPVSCFKA